MIQSYQTKRNFHVLLEKSDSEVQSDKRTNEELFGQFGFLGMLWNYRVIASFFVQKNRQTLAFFVAFMLSTLQSY